MEIYSNINLIHAENVKVSLNQSVVSTEAYEFRDQANNLTQIWNNIEFPGSILNSKGFSSAEEMGGINRRVIENQRFSSTYTYTS